MWPSHTATFAWMPWVILLTEAGWKGGGRRLVPAALAAAMQVLAGGPESILFTWLILLGMAIVECAKGMASAAVLARRFFLIGVLAVCLAAAQLLPFADFALRCSRNTHYGAGQWSMPIWGWANFLVPLFQTTIWQVIAVQYDQYWTSSYYAGIGVVFLAAMALWRQRGWRVWLLGGFVAVSLVLALGGPGFVYPWLRRLLPFVGLFRYPIKFVIITSGLMPLLAAFAIRHYEIPSNGRARLWRAEAICLGGMLILVGIILWFARHHPVENSPWPATLGNALSRLGFLAMFLWAVYFFATRPGQRRWSVLLLVLVCWLDLITAMPWQNPTLDPSVYQPALGQMTGKLNPEPNVAESRLMMSPESAQELYYKPSPDLKTAYLLDRAVFLANCNLLDNLPKVDGFFSLYLRESDRVLWLLGSHTGAELERVEDFLGVSQTIARGKLFDWVPRKTFLPMVTAGQEPIFAEDQAAFSAIGRTNVDFREVVYLPPEAKTQVIAKRNSAARIIGKQFEASKETIQVDAPAPAMVFISQAYYHNWKARVDGKTVRLWRANYAFQAVEVPAGKHEVTLLYQDKMFRIGMFLTVCAGLICLVLWALPQRTRGDGESVRF
jgi:hypothetical protein